MKKRLRQITAIIMAAAIVVSGPGVSYAMSVDDTEIQEVEAGDAGDTVDEQEAETGDNVVISEDDKPYLCLGASLKDSELKTILKLMGIDYNDLESYDVSYVTNDEEHQYLDEYIDKSAIGTRALSSVVITDANEGDGISISTYNINYCTIGMYKNALATAGIKDANIIVAGPFPISGTAALVGIFKAYEDMTGDAVEEEIVDAALDELVTTGRLNEAIDADPETVEALIAEVKSRMADGKLETEEDIRAAIKEVAAKYDVELTADEEQQIVDLITKLKGLDLDWDSLSNQAKAWADKLGNINPEGFLSSITNFFSGIVEFFKGLFS